MKIPWEKIIHNFGGGNMKEGFFLTPLEAEKIWRTVQNFEKLIFSLKKLAEENEKNAEKWDRTHPGVAIRIMERALQIKEIVSYIAKENHYLIRSMEKIVDPPTMER
jgi:hypothetical protein